MVLIRHKQQGFTIVELLIATSVFAVVLLLASIGVIQISRQYYKGLTQTRTQETARAIMDDVSKTIQFNGGTVAALPAAGDGTAGYCAGGRRYSYRIGQQLTTGAPTPNILVADSIDCSTGAAQPIGFGSVLVGDSIELGNLRMRIVRFEIDNLGNGLYRVTVRVVSGENDLLINSIAVDDATNPGGLDSCRAERSGGQFCATSELVSIVQKRVQ